jgi:hypothetical protein
VANATQDLGPYKGGRPFKSTDPAALKQAMTGYFDSCDPHVVDQVGIKQPGANDLAQARRHDSSAPVHHVGLARAPGLDRTTLLNDQDLNTTATRSRQNSVKK